MSVKQLPTIYNLAKAFLHFNVTHRAWQDAMPKNFQLLVEDLDVHTVHRICVKREGLWQEYTEARDSYHRMAYDYMKATAQPNQSFDDQAKAIQQALRDFQRS